MAMWRSAPQKMGPQVSAFRVVFVAKYSYIPDGLNLQLADIYFEILTMKSEVKGH